MIDIVAKEAAKILNCNEEIIKKYIVRPQNRIEGHYSLECFRLRGKFEESPDNIAKKLSRQLKLPEFSVIKASGPYLNFYLSKEMIIEEVENAMQVINSKEYINIYELLKKIIDNKLEANSANDLIISYQISNLLQLKNNYQESVIYNDELKAAKSKEKLIDEETKKHYSNFMAGFKEKVRVEKINGVEVVSLEEHNLPPLILDLSKDSYINNIKCLVKLSQIIESHSQDKYIYSFKKNDNLKVQQLIKVCAKAGYSVQNHLRYVSLGNIRMDRAQEKYRWAIEASLSSKEYIASKKLHLYKDEEEKIIFINIIFNFLTGPKERDKYISWTNEGAECYCIYKKALKVLDHQSLKNFQLKDLNSGNNIDENELLTEIEEYRNIIELSIESAEPYLLVEYIKRISVKLKRYMENCGNNQDSRIVKASCEVIKSIFYVLGIKNC